MRGGGRRATSLNYGDNAAHVNNIVALVQRYKSRFSFWRQQHNTVTLDSSMSYMATGNSDQSLPAASSNTSPHTSIAKSRRCFFFLAQAFRSHFHRSALLPPPSLSAPLATNYPSGTWARECGRSWAPSSESTAHVNETYRMSDQLLRYIYRTLSHRDDDENMIYRAGLVLTW